MIFNCTWTQRQLVYKLVDHVYVKEWHRLVAELQSSHLTLAFLVCGIIYFFAYTLEYIVLHIVLHLNRKKIEASEMLHSGPLMVCNIYPVAVRHPESKRYLWNGYLKKSNVLFKWIFNTRIPLWQLQKHSLYRHIFDSKGVRREAFNSIATKGPSQMWRGDLEVNGHTSNYFFITFVYTTSVFKSLMYLQLNRWVSHPSLHRPIHSKLVFVSHKYWNATGMLCKLSKLCVWWTVSQSLLVEQISILYIIKGRI